MTLYTIADVIGATASTVADDDSTGVSLGTEFYVTSQCWVTQIRWWQATTNAPSSAARTLGIYRVDSASVGTLMSGPFTSTPVGVGVQSFTLPTPFELVPNQRYRVVAFHPAGRYVANSGVFNAGTDFTAGPLVIPNGVNAVGGDQGSYFYSGSMTFPSDQFGNAFYWTGAVISDVDPSLATSGTGGVLLTDTGAPLLIGNGGVLCLFDTPIPPAQHPNLKAAYSFSENTGLTAVDASGNSRTLTLNNATWDAAGKTGSAIRSTSSSAGGRVMGYTCPPAAVTVMGWVKPLDLTSGATRPAFGFVDNGGNSQAIIYVQRGDFGTPNVVQANIRIGSLQSLAGSALTVDQWVHLALTYDGATARLVVNGATVAQTSITGSVTAGDYFAVADNLLTYTPNVVADDIRVFDAGLTDAEITTFMNTPV